MLKYLLARVSATRSFVHLRLGRSRTPRSQARSVSEADVGRESLHNLCQVGGACVHFYPEPAPKAEIGVKAAVGVCCGPVRMVGRGEGPLYIVEMAHRSWDRQVH